MKDLPPCGCFAFHLLSANHLLCLSSVRIHNFSFRQSIHRLHNLPTSVCLRPIWYKDSPSPLSTLKEPKIFLLYFIPTQNTTYATSPSLMYSFHSANRNLPKLPPTNSLPLPLVKWRCEISFRFGLSSFFSDSYFIYEIKRISIDHHKLPPLCHPLLVRSGG